METYQPSPLEIVRTANIARNQAFLSELDLISFKGTEPKAKSSATKRIFLKKQEENPNGCSSPKTKKKKNMTKKNVENAEKHITLSKGKTEEM